MVAGPEEEVLEALSKIPGVVAVGAEGPGSEELTALEVEVERGRDLRQELARAVVGGGWGLVELTTVQASLEDVFVHLVTEEEA
jgi:ABC-2 type transport system ATP-binding protein